MDVIDTLILVNISINKSILHNFNDNLIFIAKNNPNVDQCSSPNHLVDKETVKK